MIARWRARLVEWVKWTFVKPAVDALILASYNEHAATRENMRAHIEASMREHTRRVLSELGTVRVEVELLRSALATADQMQDFDKRLTSVDERLHHLTAQMFGKTVAEKIQQSRGPREFSYEDRQ